MPPVNLRRMSLRIVRVENETHNQLKPADCMIGKRVPDFSARATKVELSMSGYEGSWTLLFCHPASFTPVYTTTFIELARHKPEFDALGVELIGLSIDSVYSHINWIERIKDHPGVKVEFPVIEDTSMQVARA